MSNRARTPSPAPESQLPRAPALAPGAARQPNGAGTLGPRARTDELIAAVHADGRSTGDEQCGLGERGSLRRRAGSASLCRSVVPGSTGCVHGRWWHGEVDPPARRHEMRAGAAEHERDLAPVMDDAGEEVDPGTGHRSSPRRAPRASPSTSNPSRQIGPHSHSQGSVAGESPQKGSVETLARTQGKGHPFPGLPNRDPYNTN